MFRNRNAISLSAHVDIGVLVFSRLFPLQRENLIISPKEQCYGFITGARLLGKLYEDKLSEARLFCIPYGMQNEQVARIYVKYREQHPEKLHLNAFSLLIECFKNAFPCGM